MISKNTSNKSGENELIFHILVNLVCINRKEQSRSRVYFYIYSCDLVKKRETKAIFCVCSFVIAFGLFLHAKNSRYQTIKNRYGVSSQQMPTPTDSSSTHSSYAGEIRSFHPMPVGAASYAHRISISASLLLESECVFNCVQQCCQSC